VRPKTVKNSDSVFATLAGRTLRIETTSDFALSAVTPALGHLTAAPPTRMEDATRFTIIEETDAWRSDEFRQAGAYRLGDKGFAVVQTDPASAEWYRPESGIELRAGRAGLMAGEVRAHPGCYALAAWLTGPRTQLLHAGAVAYGGAAALIVGAGGFGKSTTALACALAGADFLADDLVLVEIANGSPGERPVSHSIFATAKLNDDSARALGAIGWPALGVTPNRKAVVSIEHRLKLARSAPIVALIMLAPPVKGPPQPQPLRPMDALTALAQTAAPMFCRTGKPAAWLALIGALAREVPAYRLPVSWTFDALEQAVRKIVAQAVDPERSHSSC